MVHGLSNQIPIPMYGFPISGLEGKESNQSVAPFPCFQVKRMLFSNHGCARARAFVHLFSLHSEISQTGFPPVCHINNNKDRCGKQLLQARPFQMTKVHMASLDTDSKTTTVLS